MNALCCVEGCSQPKRRRQYCGKHYARLLKYGEPEKTQKVANGVARSFLVVALVFETNDCIIWPFGKDRRGYARLSIDGKSRLLHRIACEVRSGPPPAPNLDAAHSCNRPSCINGKHMRWDTRAGNQADRVAAGTHFRGDNAPFAKLTLADVRRIRSLRGVRLQSELASEFSVTKQTISDIQTGRTWSHVQ